MVELPNLCPCRKKEANSDSIITFSFVSIFGLNQKKSKAILRCTPNGKHWPDEGSRLLTGILQQRTKLGTSKKKDSFPGRDTVVRIEKRYLSPVGFD
jgi:hypothetical protein